MQDTHVEEVRAKVTAAQTATAKARDDLETAETAAGAAVVTYDETPIDANYHALERARAHVTRCETDLARCVKAEGLAEAELRGATRDADREELERLQLALSRHDYAPELGRLASLDRMIHEEILTALHAKQQTRRATWQKAAAIARRLGNVAFPLQVPQPKENEAIVFARLTIASARAAEGRRDSEVTVALTPWEQPQWNDPSKQTYDRASFMLTQGAKS